MEEETEKREEESKNKSGWFANPYNKLFLLILIAAFVIRLWVFFKTSQQPLWWDEADYMSTAKRWGLDLNIRDTWYYRRGFLWPLATSLFFKFGLGEIGVRFLEVLFSTGIIALTYILVSMIFNKKIALLVTLASAVSWIYLFFTGRIMTEIPATFLLLTAAIFFWKGYVLNQNRKFIWLFGLFLGLAILIRFQFAMMVFPFIIFIFVKERFKALKNKDLWISAFVLLLVFLPLFIIYTKHYGNIFVDIPKHYFDVGVEEPTAHWKWKGLFYYFIKSDGLLYMLSWPLLISFLLGCLIYFSDLILGFDKIFKSLELQKKIFVLFFILVPFLVLGYMSEYIEQRYIMSTLPFLFSLVAIPFISLEKLTKEKIYAYALILIFLAALIPNITTATSLIDSKLTSYGEVKESALWMKANSNPGDVIIGTSLPQTTYYSERSVYTYGTQSDLSKFKTPAELDTLIQETNPRFFVISAIEPWTPEWAYTYGENHKDTMKIVQAYMSGNQPVLVIYEFINRTT